MQMIVRTVEKGKRLWSFTVDERQLYELLCNTIAVRVIRKTGKPLEEVEPMTIKLARGSTEKTEEELKQITDEFVRAVIMERKRLGLGDEYQIEDEGEEDK